MEISRVARGRVDDLLPTNLIRNQEELDKAAIAGEKNCQKDGATNGLRARPDPLEQSHC